MFRSVSPKIDFSELERKLLNHWDDVKLVKKYREKNRNSSKRFSFIDGPITANNPMGVHHAWGRTYKDLWQRFYNMRGFKQRFQNGFDCQGLWVEVEVEKELELKNKQDIERLIKGDKKASIAKFVNLCKERVKKFSNIQSEQSKRLGYFMDWDNSYYTMSDENNYMIWHFLKVCHQNGWIYKGRDSVPWCPRCETAISQHEMLTEDYKELTHESVFVKFPITSSTSLRTSNFQLPIKPKIKNLYLLVWTTTPWTVPANVAVGVNKKFTYGIWRENDSDDAIIIVEKDEKGKAPKWTIKKREVSIVDLVFKNNFKKYKKIGEVSGEYLIGFYYKAPFDYLPRVKNAKNKNPKTFHTVVDASDIVVATEGTGLLHVAPGAGQEDFKLGKERNLSVIDVIKDNADYLDGMDEFSGKNAKKHPELIIDYLREKNNGMYMFKSMHYTHRYPACWRCKTELVWKVTDEWYISMDTPSSSKLKTQNSKRKKTLREQMIGVAKKIHWIPSFGLERELDWLKNMHDWLISKPNRYWGLALPIYECRTCRSFEVIGSKEELESRAVKGWNKFKGNTPHKPWIDEVKIRCKGCSKIVERIKDVGNVWLDAGIVVYSTLVDPKTKKVSYTDDKLYWKKWFPANFITESFPGQFKNWFYSLIAMSTVLEQKPPVETVLGFGTLLAEDGKPMHKSWGNAIEFNEGAKRIGVDVMRWMYVRHDPSKNILFGYKKADQTRRQFHLMLWNIYVFFVTYANLSSWKPVSKKEISKNILDKWILSRLSKLTKEVTNSLSNYDVFSATSEIELFVSDLSTWYVRRSRERVAVYVEDKADRIACFETLYSVLVILSKLLAPFIPFLTEEIFTNLKESDSVHLSNWPINEESLIDERLEKEMMLARKIVEQVHKHRKLRGIKVRQPLKKITYDIPHQLSKEIEQLIAQEVNVKDIVYVKSHKSKLDAPKVTLDFSLTQQLKKEGEARELVRQIQILRKKNKCKLDEKVDVVVPAYPKEFELYIKKKALVKRLVCGNNLSLLTG